MKLIKALIIIFIILFPFFNYKYISFDKGISKRDVDTKNVSEFLQTATGIKSIQYYKKTITQKEPSGQRPVNYQSYDYIYRVYIVTNGDAYLLDATQDDIDAFSVLGIFSSNLRPEKITPIPFYVEIIVGFIVLIIPTKRRNKS